MLPLIWKSVCVYLLQSFAVSICRKPFTIGTFLQMEPVHIRHRSHHFAMCGWRHPHQSFSGDTAGWQAKMDCFVFWKVSFNIFGKKTTALCCVCPSTLFATPFWPPTSENKSWFDLERDLLLLNQVRAKGGGVFQRSMYKKLVSI